MSPDRRSDGQGETLSDEGDGKGEHIPFPELHEALLTEEQLAELLADIEGSAIVHDAQMRVGHQQTMPPFPEAAEALRTGVARALQVLYTYAGETWRDTLLRTPAGVKLVRIRVEPSA